jgi:hypothetical protein
LLVLSAFDQDHPELLEHDGTVTAETLALENLAGGPQVVVAGTHDLAVCIQRVDRGAAVHLLRYEYDEEADAVPILPMLSLDVRLPTTFASAAPRSPSGRFAVEADSAEGVHHLELADVPLYATVLLEP